jgi:eukaryotic-like serine/threonine-protein kinase
VTDFGIAASEAVASIPIPRAEQSTAGDESLTRTGTVVGTPAYMSPEQHAGQPVDARSDQFSFCVALWEGLFGTRPFEGSDLDELLERIACGKPAPPPRSVQVPRRITGILRRGLALDPRDRWPSMNDLLHALAHASRPWVRSAWPLAAAAAGSGAIGLVLAAVQSDPQPERRCDALLERTPTLPTDELRERWQTVDKEGARVWAKAQPLLTSLLSRWQASAEAACTAAVDPDAFAARSACLNEAASHFSLVTALLEDPDADLLAKAQDVLHQLPDPRRCDSRSSDPALSGDADLAASVGALREDIARVIALETAGRFADALQLATTALARSENIPDPRSRAQLLYQVARQLDFVGRFAEARDGLQEAAWYALEHGNDEVAIRAMSELVFVLAIRFLDPESALEWARRAEPVVARLGPTHPSVLWLRHNRANANNAAGRLQESRKEHEEVIAIQESLLPDGDLTLAAGRANLASTLVRLGDLEAAEPQITRALEALHAANGSSHPDTLSVVSVLGELAFMRGDLTSARTHFDRVIRGLGGSGDSYRVFLMTAKNGLAKIASAEGALDEALEHCRTVEQLARAQFGDDHPHVAYALKNRGDVHIGRGETSAAKSALTEALAILEAAPGTPGPEIATIHTDLAKVAWMSGDRTEADEILNRAIALLEAHPQRGGPHEQAAPLASLLAAMGTLLCDSGQHERGVLKLQQAVEVAAPVEATQRVAAKSELALARCIDPKGEAPNAREIAASARDRLQALAFPDPKELANIAAYLGEDPPK